METVLGRYKNLIVLAAVLFLQILGLAVQVRRTTDAESTRLIRVWAVGAVTPFEKLLVRIQTGTSGIWHNYFYLRGIRAENRGLKQEIERMRIEQVRMAQDADQARRLQVLLAFKEQFISETLPAQVIGWSGSEQSRSVYIDKGERDGLKPDMAVITADGIVGKVLRVFRSTSLVLLINDQSSGVGAILEKSRLQGILKGTPSGEVGLEKVMSDETVQAGERVLTSGGDRIFPKGLPIGTVTRVTPGSELFLNIRVKPSSDIAKLEEVLVVTKVDERQSTPDQTGPVRAADILAERLPTVPPKPAEGAPGAGKPPQPGATPNTGATSVKPQVPVSGTAASTTAKPVPTQGSAGTQPKSVSPSTGQSSVPGTPSNTGAKPATANRPPSANSLQKPITSRPDSTKPANSTKPAGVTNSQPPSQDNPQ